MTKLNKWWFATIIFVIVAAIFIDTYSYTYRFFVAHVGVNGQLKSNPNLLGKDLYIHKGLDIQGGTQLTIAICQGFNNPPGSTCRTGLPAGKNLSDAQTNTVTILKQRVNGLGVSESPVQAQGNDQVLVQLPGISIDQAKKVVGTTSKLHFATSVPGSAAQAPPGPNGCPLPIDRDQQHLCNPIQLSNDQYYPAGYHWKIDDAIDASDVTGADASFASNTGQAPAWVVNIQFNDKGATEWSKITNTAFAQPQGSPQNRVAIFLDNQVLTAPSVQSPSSSSTQITGNFTQEQAQSLASYINAGSLPAEIATVQANEVSATLGQDTVKKSLIAGAVGLLVVVLFMVGYYRFPGILASIALIFYSAIALAMYKLFSVTITLAGLAGFVLSVGMAVDANVLIFERMRDELRHGRTISLAVETGFRRAMPAIRDSNLSTMITCLVLYAFGSDVVKGFALTLLMGVAVSFFSAIYITRSLFSIALRFGRFQNPARYTEIHDEYESDPPKGRFDVVHSRNLFFLGSLVILIPGLLAMVFWGFRLGIDFAGGNRIDATFVTPTTQAQVQSTVETVGSNLQPRVQAEGGDTFAITTLPSTTDSLTQIRDTLDHKFHFETSNGKPKIQIQQVGPTIAKDLIRTAVVLVLVSSLFIAIYLAFTFRGQRIIRPLRFSVCTFFKLLHDVFVLAGIWAVLGHFSSLGEVDTLFVVAVLTSVSFSIHDTIVVFDRIRENLRSGPRLTFEQVVNLSTIQTMTRSINTALTVTFVLLALVLFGGSSIQGFVLALLIGIVTGTYSSIFNASTLLVAWQSLDEDKKAAEPPGRGVQRRNQPRLA